jgi:uncharacterized membrane protein
MYEHAYSVIFRKMREPWVPIWAVPVGYAVSAVLLGLTLPRLEAWILPGWTAGISSTAAMVMYSSIAGGMITLTGIVFSLVFVMVQFGATAYSPRLVLWMARDPLVFHAIGVFTATFLYAISAIAWVDRESSGKVPFFSAWLVVGLLLASVGMFIGLVHNLNRLQITNVLAFTGNFARQVIDVMYPPLETASALAGAGEFPLLPVTQRMFYNGPPLAIQSLEVARLAALAEQVNGIIEMRSAVGDTLVSSTPLLRVYGGRQVIEERDLKKAIRTGTQRTFEQDPKYSIQLLRDIAIRALSPAINDPTTAVQALDQIEDLLLRLGRRRLEIGEVRDSSGLLRLIIPVPAWEDFLDLAFSEIRSYGRESMQVMRRMKALLSDLIEALPNERIPALRRQQKRLDSTIARSFPDIEDQLEASVEDREGMGATRRSRTESSTSAL